ncbi:hypothetical protein HMPREF1988_00427 [Porphyromonas gingivalis F0185]|nr:hypothetical protein HMPREF1988_00427 [Porphyromonas gingivalis F0185]
MFTCGLLASACTMTALIPNLPNRNYIRLSPNIPPPELAIRHRADSIFHQ